MSQPTSPAGDDGTGPDAGPARRPDTPAPLWRRILWAFIEPAGLGDELSRRPHWFGAFAVGGLLTVASSLLIPGEIWQAMMREQIMAGGGEMPEGALEMGATVFRVWAVVGGGIFWAIWTLLVAGLTTVAFAFFLGDGGRFKQYLAATAHALLIVALGALLLVPLRIAQESPQLTLNVGTFFGDLGSGYLARFLNGLDLFLLWSFAVLGVMASRFDRRRSVGSAVAVLYVGLLALVALMAFIPRPV